MSRIQYLAYIIEPLSNIKKWIAPTNVHIQTCYNNKKKYINNLVYGYKIKDWKCIKDVIKSQKSMVYVLESWNQLIKRELHYLTRGRATQYLPP